MFALDGIVFSVEKEEIRTHVRTTRVNLEDIVLSIRSRSQKDRCYMMQLVCGTYGSQTHKNVKEKGVCPGPGERRLGVSV